jgi:excisionase family DNA binding protein
MKRDDNPLFALTIGEFSELAKRIIAEEVQKLADQIHDPNRDTKNDGDIGLIEQACQITGLKKSTIYSKLSKKQMPSLSRRKPLLFSKKQLQMWIKAGRPKTDDP